MTPSSPLPPSSSSSSPPSLGHEKLHTGHLQKPVVPEPLFGRAAVRRPPRSSHWVRCHFCCYCSTANDTACTACMAQSKWSIFPCFTTSQVHLGSIFPLHSQIHSRWEEKATQQFPSLPDFPEAQRNKALTVVVVVVDGIDPVHCLPFLHSHTSRR